MLEEILNIIPIDATPNPISIMTDFEKAAMNAFEKKFPASEIAVCYFHLGQSLWRRIQNMGLSNK